MHRRMLLAIILAAGMSPAVMAQTIQSTFDSGLEGWTTSAGGSITFSATGGNPGGFLQQADLDLTDMFVTAPALFLGDLSAFLGGTVTFDVRQIIGTADYPPFGIVQLRSGGNNVFADIVPPGNPGVAWSTHSVTLDAASFATSPANFASILSNLTALEVTLESQVGVNETVGFDNFSLAVAVPEPSGMIFVAAVGIGACVVWRKRRKR
jgi:hypothetical protein